MLFLDRMRSLRNAENPGVSCYEEAEWIRLRLRWERLGPQSWAKGHLGKPWDAVSSWWGVDSDLLF